MSEITLSPETKRCLANADKCRTLHIYDRETNGHDRTYFEGDGETKLRVACWNARTSFDAAKMRLEAGHVVTVGQKEYSIG